MRRTMGAIGACTCLALLLAVGGLAVPVSAHTNHVGVDAQVSANGTVVAETVFIGTDGFVVLHEVNGSEPGEPVGHAPVSAAGGLKEDVAVEVDAATWRQWEDDRQLWAVLHADDGDGTFEPEEDEVIESFGDPAGDRFALAKGQAAAYVTAQGFSPQTSDDGTVTVRAATLPADGHVVLRVDTDDGPGEPVGSTAVPAGTSRNVTVQINAAHFGEQQGSFTLYAALHVDDGDGTFGEADDLVTADGEAVATRFGVEKNRTATETPTTAEGDDHGGEGHDDHDGDGHDDHDHSADGTATEGAAADADADGTANDGAGFGPLVALVAFGSLVAAWRRR